VPKIADIPPANLSTAHNSIKTKLAMDTLATINAKTREAYNLAANKYHELFHNEMKQKEYDRKLLDGFAVGFGQDSLVCDAGCGPSGQIGRYLFNQGIPVIGVDIADHCVQLARQNNPQMRFERCDMAEMPFVDETFDGILAYYSIIDTPKQYVGRIFREFYRTLKPGGCLLVAVKAGSSEGYQAELLGIKTQIYFTLFQLDEIQRYFTEAQFEIEFLQQRDPYGFEITAERIFAIGRKR
jgi:ubiquinone/menaquinone biosynthesis C-methylase UbiE